MYSPVSVIKPLPPTPPPAALTYAPPEVVTPIGYAPAALLQQMMPFYVTPGGYMPAYLSPPPVTGEIYVHKL